MNRAQIQEKKGIDSSTPFLLLLLSASIYLIPHRLLHLDRHRSSTQKSSSHPKMTIFRLDSKKHFIHSKSGTTLAVHELEPFFSPAVKPEHWKPIAVVGADLEHDELEVFDVIIHGKALTSLVQDLNRSRLIVNREGYCFLNCKEVSNSNSNNPPYGTMGYYRINDLFGWSKYGVFPAVTTIWNRCDMQSCKVVVNLVREQVKGRRLGRQETYLRREVEGMRLEVERMRRELEETKRKLEVVTEDLGMEREYSKDLVSIVRTLKEMVVEVKKKHDGVHEVLVL